MRSFCFIVFLQLFPLVSFAQLSGKVVTISDDSLCRSTLHFTSDSIAYYVTRCGDNQMCTKMNYLVNDFGNVMFFKISDSLYKPVISLTRVDPKSLGDSMTTLPRLVFLDKGRIVSNSSWILWGNGGYRKTGTDLNAIPTSFFTDTSAMIQFNDLYGLTRKFQKFQASDFVGAGSVYCVNLDLPPLFGDCRTIYHSEFFNLSQLHYRVMNGKLYEWNTPEWIPVME